jgi:hypothetical protein
MEVERRSSTERAEKRDLKDSRAERIEINPRLVREAETEC